jgi:molybdate transport system regulatory protein
MMISARNQMDVTVTEIDRGVVNSLVTLQSAKGLELMASVTNRAVETMHLQPGERVVAFFKASHVLVATGWAMQLSARNRLTGKVEAVQFGAVNAEVVIRLADGDPVTSVITNQAARDLAVETGSDVTAIIKASDVMIAK